MYLWHVKKCITSAANWIMKLLVFIFGVFYVYLSHFFLILCCKLATKLEKVKGREFFLMGTLFSLVPDQIADLASSTLSLHILHSLEQIPV